MSSVRPKKNLGQHFLKNEAIAQNIAESLLLSEQTNVLEIGPGMGVLTKYLAQRPEVNLRVVELDTESVEYLDANGIVDRKNIISGDFLKMPLDDFFTGEFCITGNYPYNISSQILFKVYENRDRIPQLTGMFQKEVAARVCSGPNSKEYGILSVLLQAYYNLEYLFTVEPTEFNPPPKVRSGVMRMTRNKVTELGCDEVLFKKVIKAGFNLRRKTLRNSMKTLLGKEKLDHPFMDRRPEQLNVQEFIELTNLISEIID